MTRIFYPTVYSGNQTDLSIVDEKQLLRYLALEGLCSYEYLFTEKVEVKRLRRKDIRQASRTLLDATEHDPFTVYLRDTPDARDRQLFDRIERLRFAIGALQWSERNWGWTVNHGRAIVCANPAPASSKKTKLEKKLDKLYRMLNHTLDLIGKSKLQRKRMADTNRKLEKFIEETLGADFRHMRSVNSLATAPNYQRRGYGGALLEAVNKLADAEHRSTYLLSSNPAVNTEFYNSHGYFTIAEILIGDDDPTWHGPPIPIPLMVRIYGDK